jgi:hypothetical protein
MSTEFVTKARPKQKLNSPQLTIKTNNPMSSPLIKLVNSALLLLISLNAVNAKPFLHPKALFGLNQRDSSGQLSYFLPSGYPGACGTPIQNSDLVAAVVRIILENPSLLINVY